MTRVVFAGTPEFARASLSALVDAGIVPVAVLTQPDRPAGRGRKLNPGPVKIYAQSHGMPVLQPESLKDSDIVAELSALKADLFVVAAYGLLLPPYVLDIPRASCVNVHASLLPRWRGAAPIQSAILAGDAQTGISLMRMEAGLDSGPVYARASIQIGATETAGDVHDRLARLGGELLLEHITGIVDGSADACAQDENQVTYAPRISTADAELRWVETAVQLQRVVRAFNPVPGAWTKLAGERLKCWSAQVTESSGAPPGTIIRASSNGIDVACGDGCLRMTQLQRPGKNRLSASEFAGQIDSAGMVFG